MLLTNEQIAKFQAIWKVRFGKEISRAEALEKGIKLLPMMQIIYKPMTVEQYQRLQERRRQTAGNNEMA